MTTEGSTSSFNALSDREKKLFELRLQLNKVRKENNQLVFEEERKSKEPANADAKREREEYWQGKEKEKEKLIEEGKNPEREKLLHITASQADWKEKKRKKSEKNSNSFGWDQYNSEAQYKAYKKRVKDVNFDKSEYESKKQSTSQEEFFPNANSLIYGQPDNAPKEKVDKMVEELNKTVTKRKSFSRRRAHMEESYVNYVNDRNKQFNQKISKAFDKYTVEIRQNLERGTAV